MPLIGSAIVAGRDELLAPLGRATPLSMTELIRTNDMVLLSFAEALLKDAGIACAIFDQNMSVIEGSLGVLPRRLLVDSEAVEEARRLLTDAGLEKNLR